MEILGQIIGFTICFLLLRLAYKLFDKDKITQCIFAAWAAVFILLCSFSWFQGWAKSYIASNITSKLASLGEHVPINNSVEAYAKDPHGFAEQRIILPAFLKNISISIMSGFDTNATSFYFRYVADNRDTNYYQQMPKMNQDIFVSDSGWSLK